MDPTTPPDPLLRALGQLEWPMPALDQPDPKPGQLWRAAWDDLACLVVVLARPAGRTVLVAGATPEHVGDEGTVIAATATAMSPVVWANVSDEIKTFTLEHRLADLTATSFAEVLDAAGGRPRGAWPPIVDDLDDRALVRADLGDRLRGLAEADWLPQSAAEGPTLEELAAAASITPSSLAPTLGISFGDARRLLRGQREPTESELDALTELLGAVPTPAVGFDEDLMADIDSPEFRPALRAAAANEHLGDEVAARRAYAGKMMALAARQREPGRRNWKVLLREAFDED